MNPTIETTKEFRKYGKQMIDFIADYHDNIRDIPLIPDVKPGYLRKILPTEAPELPQSWESILDDLNNAILPGVSHWHSPRFHAYFPSGNSYPSLIGGILGDAIGALGFTWMSNPACTELETITMDWLCKMIGLPEHFMHSSPGNGGGALQCSASDSILIALLASKTRKLKEIGNISSEQKLVSYHSNLAHSSMERAALFGNIKSRGLETDDKFSLRGEVLENAIKQDKAKGLIPCFLGATLGTTSICSFDNIKELGAIAQREGMWMHVDAAYAGNAFICPENRYLMDGIEYADSFNVNCSKGLMVNYPCCPMYLKDSTDVVDAFNVDPEYLKHNYQESVPDYRHWTIQLGRKMKSLNLWFVLKNYGVNALQEHIRGHISLAKYFKGLMESDGRFELFTDVTLGLICFRYKGSDKENQELFERINEARNIHMSPVKVNGTFVLRISVNSRLTDTKDIEYTWSEISRHADMFPAKELKDDVPDNL